MAWRIRQVDIDLRLPLAELVRLFAAYSRNNCSLTAPSPTQGGGRGQAAINRKSSAASQPKHEAKRKAVFPASMYPESRRGRSYRAFAEQFDSAQACKSMACRLL